MNQTIWDDTIKRRREGRINRRSEKREREGKRGRRRLANENYCCQLA